jgi:transposase
MIREIVEDIPLLCAKKMDDLDLSNITRIAVDDTSSICGRCGHRYVTLVVDVDSKRVIFVTAGKDSSVILSLKNTLRVR